MKYPIFFATALCATIASAQDDNKPKQVITYEQYLSADAQTLWKSSLNAVGLTAEPLIERGSSYLQLSQEKRRFGRVQEGDRMNDLTFHSEQYKKVGKYLNAYGSVNFEMGRIFNRSWNDLYRSYNSNPYISGSAILGKYDYQNVDFTAMIASVPLHRFIYGVRLDYKVGDLSRLKDPRPRTRLAEYRLMPSVGYTAGKHTLALGAYYHRRKEKLVGITTVQSSSTFIYYQMTGLENAVGTVGGYSGYGREYVDHIFGGELSYQYKANGYQTLLTAHYARGNEDMWESEKANPGTYTTLKYGARWNNLLRTTGGLHHLNLDFQYGEGAGDEYRQQEVKTTDPNTGLTSTHWVTILEYNNRYTSQTIDANVDYQYLWNKGKEGAQAYVGGRAGYEKAKNVYDPAYSRFDYQYLHMGVNGGLGIQMKGNTSLWVEPTVAYRKTISTHLNLADATTDYAVNVLIPDMTYYQRNYWKAGMALTYNWEMRIKGYPTRWFVKAKGDYLRANGAGENTNFSIAVGLFH